MLLSQKHAGAGSLGLLLLSGLLILGGCRDNPGTWGAEQVTTKIAASLELSDVTLSPRPEGGFAGSGKRADGETITFTISQNAEAHRMSWDAKGDRGFVEEGFYELK